MSVSQSQSLKRILAHPADRQVSLLILLSLVGYIIFAFWFPIWPNADRVPLLDIRSFAPSLWQGALYGLLITGLFTSLILIIRRLPALQFELKLPEVLIVSTIFSLPLLMVYPINANDIYRYLIRGRITVYYEQNPFSAPPTAFPEDPFLPLAGEWAAETSPYGPLWEMSAGGIAYFTEDDVLLGLLAFKAFIFLAFLGTTIVLWHLLGAGQNSKGEKFFLINAEQRKRLTILWAWNPALLFIFMIDGHNDIVLIFWLLLGFLVISLGYSLPGFLIMILGALSKPIGALALPIIFIGLLREKKTWTERLRFIFLASAGSGFLIFMFFLPFGSAWDLIQRLLREAGAGGGFSPAVVGLLAAQELGLSLTRDVISSWTTFLVILFMGFTLWLLWRTWRGRSIIRGTADIFFAYIVQALNYRIWYAAWPFPWLLLDSAKGNQSRTADYRLYFGFWFLLTSQLSVLIYGHMRIELLQGSQTTAHLVGVPFTFLLPILMAWISVKKGLFEPPQMEIKS